MCRICGLVLLGGRLRGLGELFRSLFLFLSVDGDADC
jgi:hypothetical protein